MRSRFAKQAKRHTRAGGNWSDDFADRRAIVFPRFTDISSTTVIISHYHLDVENARSDARNAYATRTRFPE